MNVTLLSVKQSLKKELILSARNVAVIKIQKTVTNKEKNVNIYYGYKGYLQEVTRGVLRQGEEIEYVLR